jgi:hypothetical protein
VIAGCRHEQDVRAASAEDRWTPALRSHADSCRTCADVALVTFALRDQRPAPIVTRDASLIWVCAKHARRLVTEARLSLAMMAITTIAATVALAVLLSFVDWRSFWTTTTRTELSAATGVTAAAGMLIVAALIRVRVTARG